MHRQNAVSVIQVHQQSKNKLPTNYVFCTAIPITYSSPQNFDVPAYQFQHVKYYTQPQKRLFYQHTLPISNSNSAA